ncbi:MAG: DHA2 family efflux MFS transporter permease subunit [Solirubrobacterales bacterium]|nr:DHA2 family efflux MFS transporter permease subunit [Solirubrobacterales bacterium]
MTSASTVSEATSAAAAAAPEAAARTRQRGPSPRTVLAIASLGAAVAFVDATIVNIAFPNIERSFSGTPISSLSWVLNAYNIVLAAFLVAAGRIADLLGRRRIFMFGLEVFTIASLLCAIAPSVDALIAFRVLQALGAACLVPSALALVLNAFSPALRSHGVALLSAVAAAAAGLGPSLGGLLIAAGDWRLVFLVNLPIGAAAALLARRYLVESRAPGRRRMPDLLGALIFAFAIAALVLGVVKGQEWGWTSARIIVCFAVALVLGAVFARRCSRHSSPIVDLTLLRIRTFSVANAMTIITAAGFYGYTLTNVLFLTGVWRYSVLGAGLALTPGPLVAAAVAGPTSRLVHRIGPRPVLLVGGLIWGGAVLWFVERIGATPEFFRAWLPGILMLGVGAGTLFPNLSGAAVASAPGQSFATATGLNSVSRQVGAALGVAIVVAIIGTPSPLTAVAAFHDAWEFGAACLFASAIGCLFVGRVYSERTPSLGDAAREVLQRAPATSPVTRSRPRARRAIVLDATSPAPARVQSAADFLGHVPLFAKLEPKLRETIATQARPVSIAAGQWLFREGDPGDVMYVVRTGRLLVVDESAGATIRELGRGDWVGELSLLTASPRSASVRAARASELLAVAKDDFERLLAASPALSLAMTAALASQLRATRAPAPKTRPLAATVALVALDPSVPLADLARRLAAALGRHLSAAVLDGSEVAVTSPGAGAADAYAPALDRAEAVHDMVLLESRAGASRDPWSEFSLQQADRILAFTAGGEASPGLTDRHELRGCDLVGYDISPGSGKLAAWAQALSPIESHSVRSDMLEPDLERVARRLSGHSVGIVLSGGGARAFAHIGVLEELTAAGVVVDRVAGVSMGAFVGALFAMGLDAEETDARCFEEWVRRSPLRDYTVPRHGLIRGERVKAMLHRTFGTVAIEELPRSFICGCAELRSGQLVVKRSGPLWEGVGFSINIPIIGPPQVRGGDLLIDGSLVDNLPVRSMAELGEGPIIAVDVKATFNRGDDRRQRPVGREPRERIPSLAETITRVLLLGSANTSEAARQHADLTIRPRAEGVGLLEFHQLDVAREAGRDAARSALEAAPPELFF